MQVKISHRMSKPDFQADFLAGILRAENSARLLCFRVLAFAIPYYIILPRRLCQYFCWVLKRAVL